MDEGRVAVVGGSLAGLRAAEQLRRVGHTGPITVYGAEEFPPYTRPPLSKEVLAHPEASDADTLLGLLEFRRRSQVDDVEFRLGVEVLGVELHAALPGARSGALLTWRGRDGREGVEHVDGLVAATGLRPRVLDVPGPTAGRHVLRTLTDCLALREALRERARVVVVGGGFVGTEVACTLRGLGHQVTVVEPTGAPMNRVLGASLAEAVQHHHEAAGIDFVTGQGVESFAGAERVEQVVLADGRLLPADLVVESVGSVPNVEWLRGNGLDLSDGVLCDNALAVLGAERMVSVGDVARFPNPLFDEVPRRVEHWSMPTETAKRAAPTLLAMMRDEPVPHEPFAPIPSFWTDQGELRLQSFGSPGLGDARLEEGDLDRLLDGVLVTYHVADRHVGTVAVNLPPARQRALRDALVRIPVPPTEARS